MRLEKAKTIELSLRRPVGQFRFDATAYYTHFNGFIYRRLTGLLCGEDFNSCGNETGFTQVVYSQQNANFIGAEIKGQYDVAELGSGMFGLDAQFDVVRARFADGSNVPRIPPARVGAGAYWQDGQWYARAGLLHAFAQNATATNETFTGGYNDVRAEMRYKLKLDPHVYGFCEMNLSVFATNLLDQQIRNAVSFRKDDVLMPGRSVRIAASLKF